MEYTRTWHSVYNTMKAIVKSWTVKDSLVMKEAYIAVTLSVWIHHTLKAISDATHPSPPVSFLRYPVHQLLPTNGLTPQQI